MRADNRCSLPRSQVADNHRLPLLSAFDTYAAGLANLEPSHMGTPYAGTYGCPLDHGISPPGMLNRALEPGLALLSSHTLLCFLLNC